MEEEKSNSTRLSLSFKLIKTYSFLIKITSTSSSILIEDLYKTLVNPLETRSSYRSLFPITRILAASPCQMKRVSRSSQKRTTLVSTSKQRRQTGGEVAERGRRGWHTARTERVAERGGGARRRRQGG